MRQVEDLKATGHIGNGKVYERDLHLFCKYDSKAKERLFSEIDVKYINRLNMAMEKNGCCGNTRMHTLKTLRAVINKAIKEKAASNNTYPFGKGGFEINKLAEDGKTLFTANGLGVDKELASTKFGIGACPSDIPLFLLLLWYEFR